MAATRLIALHINKGKTIAQTLADRTDYSKNEEKTEGGKYISSYECDARTADEQFLLSKRQYEHMTGRRQKHDVIAYQIRQSFKPGEVTPEEANRIGYELGMRFTKGKHAFIVATHTDRAHIHNHIIFNSTSLDCTRKFRDFHLSGLALQRVSDRLCLEHGLSVIVPRPYRERKKRTEYPKRTSNRDDLRAAIDAAMQRKPKDFEELISFLKEAGCEYKPGKRPSVRCRGQERFARFSSLGEGYTVDDLKDAIAGKRRERSAGKSQQVHDKKFSLLIDIQAKLNEGKGAGYQRWATLFNLKQMAQVMCFLQENEIDSFVNAGMCADFAIHDTGGGNPHAHIMLTMRPIQQDGAWGAKQKKEYILDPQGKKIYDPKKRQYKCKAIPATDWNEQTKAEEWRAAWAQLCNRALEQYGHAERIDHRSYERQGIDQIPTVHLGVAASAMEKRGDLNREIEVTNQKLRQLKARIAKLQKWLKEEQENAEPPTLADLLQGILSRRAREGKSQYSQSRYNLKDAAKMLNFLQTNNIMDMAGLDEKFKSMIGEQFDIQHKLKPVERRLGTLKKHIEQADIYFKYKGKKKLTEAEQILFTAAHDYLKGVMNGKTALPVKAWKAEYAKLTAERDTLNRRYLALKGEVKEAEQIRRSVYNILRQEQREQQPRRAQDMER